MAVLELIVLGSCHHLEEEFEKPGPIEAPCFYGIAMALIQLLRHNTFSLHVSSVPRRWDPGLCLGTDWGWWQKGSVECISSKDESRGCQETGSKTDEQRSTAEVGCGPPVLFALVIRFFFFNLRISIPCHQVPGWAWFLDCWLKPLKVDDMSPIGRLLDTHPFPSNACYYDSSLTLSP